MCERRQPKRIRLSALRDRNTRITIQRSSSTVTNRQHRLDVTTSIPPQSFSQPRSHHASLPPQGQSSPPRLSGLKLGKHPIEAAGLTIPRTMSQSDQRKLVADLQAEIEYQVKHPPCLPRSRIHDLPPKPITMEYVKVPDDAPEDEKERLNGINNSISTQNQMVDRYRNNQAAKKSRETRVESLNNAKGMLNEQAAEITWLRLKLRILGGEPKEWASVPAEVKADIVGEISARVEEEKEKDMEWKKKLEAQKRIDRNKEKAMARLTGGARNALSSMGSPTGHEDFEED